MAYDRQFLRVSWLFAIGGTDETAVTSCNFSVIPLWTEAAEALEELDLAGGQGQALIDDMFALMSINSLQWAGYSDLVGVKVAAVGVDGLNLSAPQEFSDTTPSAGSFNVALPQNTVCCTTWSGSSFGTANFGRMYLPHTALPLATGTPKSTVTITNLVVASFSTLLNSVAAELNSAITPTVQPFIMSNSAPAPSKPVLFVRVGDVTDTQRRRRAQLTEIYSEDTIP